MNNERNNGTNEIKTNDVINETVAIETPETKFIFRPYMTLKDGRVIWARNYGKRAFKIPVA